MMQTKKEVDRNQDHKSGSQIRISNEEFYKTFPRALLGLRGRAKLLERTPIVEYFTGTRLNLCPKFLTPKTCLVKYE